MKFFEKLHQWQKNQLWLEWFRTNDMMRCRSERMNSLQNEWIRMIFNFICQSIIFALFGIEEIYNFDFHFHIARALNQIQLFLKLFIFNMLNESWSIRWIVFVGYLVQWKIISFQKGSNIRDLRVDIRPIVIVEDLRLIIHWINSDILIWY